MNDASPPTDRITVTVWHNIATDHTGRPIGMIDGYQPGHPLVPVAHWSVAAGTPRADVLAETFAVLNIGDDPDFGTPDRRVLLYRARGNRSLSIGDVIQIGATWNAVAPVGFTTIAAEPDIRLGARRPGTRPLIPLSATDHALAGYFDAFDLDILLLTAVEMYQYLTPMIMDTSLSSSQRDLLERLVTALGDLWRDPDDGIT